MIKDFVVNSLLLVAHQLTITGNYQSTGWIDRIVVTGVKALVVYSTIRPMDLINPKSFRVIKRPSITRTHTKRLSLNKTRLSGVMVVHSRTNDN